MSVARPATSHSQKQNELIRIATDRNEEKNAIEFILVLGENKDKRRSQPHCAAMGLSMQARSLRF